MIVDSSALIAIIFQEPGYEVLGAKLAEAGSVGIGTPTLAETGIVLSARQGADASVTLGRLIQAFGLVIIPFGDEHWREAVAAYSRFGRGQHPAGLNFGDCMTYATARLSQQPLLFVGDDFSQTDLAIA